MTPQPIDLVAFAHQHEGARTLSACISIPATAADPEGQAQTLLRDGIAAARSTLARASYMEMLEFDECAARTVAALRRYCGDLAGRTWLSFAVAKDSHYTWTEPGQLPASISAQVSWDLGLRVGPYFALSPPRRNGEIDAVNGVLSRARSSVLGVLGLASVQVALAQRAVDTLVVSADMLRADPAGFERLVRNAMRQNARVQVVTDAAADHLNHEAAGIAARVRFPIAAPAA